MNCDEEHIKQLMEDKFKSMQDNTVEHDNNKKLSFAKLHMPASVVDFLFEHYGFSDLVELNTVVLYVMKSFGHMEKDGFKFAIYKKAGDNFNSYQLDIHELITTIKNQLAKSIEENKVYDPDIKIEQKESDEKNNL